MKFLQFTAIVIFYLFFECDSRSVHLHEETRPAFPGDEEKPLIHRHENKDTVSWMKLKPILRRELQELSKSKDAKPAEVIEDVHYTQSNSKENSYLIVNRSEHGSSVETVSKRTDVDQTDIVKNVTLIQGKESDFSEVSTSNVLNTSTGKLEETLHKNEFPYNITPDILTQKGDMIVFLAVNKENKPNNDIFNETLLIEEGTTVSVEDISVTEYELLRDFEKQQNLLENKLYHMQVNVTHNSSTSEMELNIEPTQLPFNDEPELKELEESSTFEEGEITKMANNLKEEIVVETSPNDGKYGLILNLTNFENGVKLSSDSTFIQKLEPELQEVEKQSPFEKEEMVTGMSINLEGEIAFETSPSDENSGSMLNMKNFSNLKNGEHVSPNSNFSRNEMLDPVDKMFNEASATRANLNKHRIESDNIEEILTHSLQKEKVNVSNMKDSGSKCPDPGVCIFWFLAFDTCEEDNHCVGSLICCMWGCSKLCMDVNSEFPQNIF